MAEPRFRVIDGNDRRGRMEATMTASPERMLVHGPRLDDLTDLLYFDKIVYPATMAMIRPEEVPPGYGGYALPEPFGEEIRDKLRNAGLLMSPGELHMQSSIQQIFADSGQGLEGLTERLSAIGQQMGAGLAETAFCTLFTHASAGQVTHLMAALQAKLVSLSEFATDPEIHGWLADIDACTRTLADLAEKQGKRATAKYYLEDVDRTLKPGTDSALSVVLAQLPTIDLGRTNVDELLSFLSSEETKVMRRRLFNWQNDLQVALERGDRRPEDIPDLIATLSDDYTAWVGKAGFASNLRRAAEFVLALGEATVEALTVVGIPSALQKVLQLRQRKLDLTREELSAPGREIAYIVHCKRSFGL
jgi:hypothetical protein